MSDNPFEPAGETGPVPLVSSTVRTAAPSNELEARALRRAQEPMAIARLVPDNLSHEAWASRLSPVFERLAEVHKGRVASPVAQEKPKSPAARFETALARGVPERVEERFVIEHGLRSTELAKTVLTAWGRRHAVSIARGAPPGAIMVLRAQAGRGKTSALAWLVANVRESARFVTAIQLAQIGEVDWSGARARTLGVRLVCIDECGLGDESERTTRRIGEHMISSYNAGAMVIAATNLDLEQFCNRYFQPPFDAIVESRLKREQATRYGIPDFVEVRGDDLRGRAPQGPELSLDWALASAVAKMLDEGRLSEGEAKRVIAGRAHVATVLLRASKGRVPLGVGLAALYAARPAASDGGRELANALLAAHPGQRAAIAEVLKR